MIWEMLGVLARLPVMILAFVFLPRRWRIGPVWCWFWLHDEVPTGYYRSRCRVCGAEINHL